MGSGIVEVSLGGTGGWVADMAPPTFDIGSTTVAYVLVARGERNTGRVYANKRHVEGRRAAIVDVAKMFWIGREEKKVATVRREDIGGLLKILFSHSLRNCQIVKMSECHD